MSVGKKLKEPKLGICKRENPCARCENKKCWHCGKIEADCPYYHCPREGAQRHDCENCGLVADYIKCVYGERGMK